MTDLILGIKTKLLKARMSQANHKLSITSATHRTFGRSQWQQIRNVLSKWRGNLNKVEDNMKSVLNSDFEMITAS